VYGDVLEFKQTINSIMVEILSISKKLNDNEEEGNMSLEWKFAAMVLDKLCLYVFAILTITLTCGILMSSPNFFKLT
jgi:nicotinic acetylcholine receptor